MNFGAGLAVLVFLAALASAGFMYFKRAGVQGAPAPVATAPFANFDNGGEPTTQRFAARLTDDAGPFSVVAVATPADEAGKAGDWRKTTPTVMAVLHDRFRADESAEERAREQIASLADHFSVITGDTEDEIETIGQLRAAIGLHPFGSGAAARAVRDWLDQQPQTALVAWIGRDGDGQPAVWLLGRRGLSEAVVEDAYQALAEVEWARSSN